MNKELREEIKYHLNQKELFKEKRKLIDKERDLAHKECLDSIRNYIKKQQLLNGCIFEANDEALTNGRNLCLHLSRDEYEEDNDELSSSAKLAKHPKNVGARTLMKICEKIGGFQIEIDGSWIEVDKYAINISFNNINDCTQFLDKYNVNIKTDLVKTIKMLNSQAKKLTVLNEKLRKYTQDK